MSHEILHSSALAGCWLFVLPSISIILPHSSPLTSCVPLLALSFLFHPPSSCSQSLLLQHPKSPAAANAPSSSPFTLSSSMNNPFYQLKHRTFTMLRHQTPSSGSDTSRGPEACSDAEGLYLLPTTILNSPWSSTFKNSQSSPSISLAVCQLGAFSFNWDMSSL